MDPETSIQGFHITGRPSVINSRIPPLPLEILVEILLLSLPPVHHAQAPHITALALVCHFWNTVIHSTPILWSRISIADKIPYVQKSLLKSGKAPLDVYGAYPTANSPVNHEHHLQFLRDVGRHAERWKHATLQVRPTEKQDSPVTILPLLESIKLRAKYPSQVPDVYLSLLDNAGGRTPHLRQISLYTAVLPRWDVLFPPSLSKLTMKNIWRSGPSSLELLSILAACPNLVVLRLYQVFSALGNSGLNSNADAAPTVQLAALQKLSLRDIPESLARDLLAQLRLPDDCIISVRSTISNANPTTSFLNTAFSHHREALQRAGEIRQIKIDVTRSGFSLLAAGGRWHIRLVLGLTPSVRDVLEWFGLNIESGSKVELHPKPLPDQLVSLEFSESAEVLSGFDYLASVFDLGCITKIKTTHLCSIRQAALFSYLSRNGAPAEPMPTTATQELTGDPGAGTHKANPSPFPCLRDLVVNGRKNDALKDVIDFVRSRADDGTVSGVPGTSARLKRIEFVDASLETIQSSLVPSLVPHPEEASWDLLAELLDVMDNDGEVYWHGQRVVKAGIVE
ncbi:hypothetical protein FRC01_007282 [Tulasnella sp. 417]|nr:hypothetical protein FRC01_007282 [Tulasnella sp. 417]